MTTPKTNEDIADDFYLELSKSKWFKEAIAHDTLARVRNATIRFTGEKADVCIKRMVREALKTKDRECDARVEEAVKKERQRILKALPPEIIIHEYYPKENTPENRSWNVYRAKAIEAITQH